MIWGCAQTSLIRRNLSSRSPGENPTDVLLSQTCLPATAHLPNSARCTGTAESTARTEDGNQLLSSNGWDGGCPITEGTRQGGC